MKKDIIIAIDGYSSCGKSTYARAIANELNYTYLDSGAMYRAVSLYCIEKGLVHDNEIDTEKLKKELINIHIEFRKNKKTGLNETWLNGQMVEDKIRGIDVSQIVSKVSKIKEVRERLVEIQRHLGRKKGIVMEGRDIGSVVFPDAEIKIFMVADTNIRAERRYRELKEKGIDVSMEEIRKNIEERDHLDLTRKESPLIKASDAIVLDNSNMTVEAQTLWLMNMIKEKFE